MLSLEIQGSLSSFLPVSRRKPSAANLACLERAAGVFEEGLEMQSSNRLWNIVQGKLISFGQDLVSSGHSCGNWELQNGKLPGREKKTPPNHFVQVIQCKW